MDGRDKRWAVLIIDDSPEKINQLMATLQKECGGKLAPCALTAREAAHGLPEDTILLNMVLHKTDAARVCSSHNAATIDQDVTAPCRLGAEQHAARIRHELANANHAILLGTSLLSRYWEDLVARLEMLDDECEELSSCNGGCLEARKNGLTVLENIIDSARKIEARLAGLHEGVKDSAGKTA
jgi:hypothetical protein